MKKRELQDLLALHADHLVAGRDQTEELLAWYGGEVPDLAPLLQMAQRLRRALLPVSPRPGFVQQLQQDLRQGNRQLTVTVPESPRISTWLGAMTLGSLLSLIGVILFLRRQRSRPGLVEITTG